MAQLNDTMVQGDLRVTGKIYGNSTSTDKLATARTAYAKLATSSNSTQLDWGSSPVEIPVYNTLGVGNGGTGMATASYKNAVVIGNSSTVTSPMQTVRTASGAFYATATDGKPTFGKLPIAQGGTNATDVATARNNLSVYSKAEVDAAISNTLSNSCPIIKKQSTDFTNWDQFTDTGVYEIGGQPSGVFNSPESGRMTLYVTKSTTESSGSGNGRYFVTQLAVGNHVYRRSLNYKSATDEYVWSEWEMIDGDVTFNVTMGSGDVTLAAMKTIYATTSNISIIISTIVENTSVASKFWLTDVVYNTNNEITAFHFSRSSPYPSNTGTMVKYILNSSGWSASSINVAYAVQTGSANTANSAATADSASVADKAYADGEGNNIVNTYLRADDAGSRSMLAETNSYRVYTSGGRLYESDTSSSDYSLKTIFDIANVCCATKIHWILDGDGTTQTIGQRSNNPESQSLAVGRRYVLTVQNVSSSDTLLRIQVGGKDSSVGYNDRCIVYHDGVPDEQSSEPSATTYHMHNIGTVKKNSWKSWEIICYEMTIGHVSIAIATID